MIAHFQSLSLQSVGLKLDSMSNIWPQKNELCLESELVVNRENCSNNVAGFVAKV